MKIIQLIQGPILINRQKNFLGNDGTQRLTIAHDLIHWYLYQKYYELLVLLDDDNEMMSCKADPSYYDEEIPLA